MACPDSGVDQDISVRCLYEQTVETESDPVLPVRLGVFFPDYFRDLTVNQTSIEEVGTVTDNSHLDIV